MKYDKDWQEKKNETVLDCYECGKSWIEDKANKLYWVDAEGKGYQVCGKCLNKLTVGELFFEVDDLVNATVCISEIDLATAYDL